MSQLFISDLHLDENAPEITAFFYSFLDKIAPGAEKLFILGDFFEAWIGDDEQTALQVEVAAKLSRLNQAGTEIFLMHGNRDFLIGESYAQQCCATLLTDPTVIDLYGRKALLIHGDSLCIDDKEYMKFRGFARSSAWQQQVLTRPLEDRKKMAMQMRQLSMAKNQGKTQEIMDVNQDEVIRVMQDHNVDLMIHGHTHRPAEHPIILNDQPASRIVLGDWHDTTWLLNVSDTQPELTHLKFHDLQ